MLSQGTLRRTLCLIFLPLIAISTVLVFRSGIYSDIPNLEPAPGEKPKPLYKPVSKDPAPPPITDNFPLAALAKSPNDIPPIPSWNSPPSPHVNESTPLFIGFTRNWRLLQQTVVSYLTAGWPPEDIYVVENTGVMHSNLKAQLTLQNPFYIDHHRLTEIFGINVIRTPTLFTFAQLQNFYTYTALENGWDHYFWAHMDTIVVSDEEVPVAEGQSYQSLYTRAVLALRETLDPAWGPLATRWFAYDRLALVRTQGFVDVGGWDTLIPFYMTDCDMHERLWMAGLRIEDAVAGKVWDVASSLDDLLVLYTRGSADQSPGTNDEAARMGGSGRKEKRRGWDDDTGLAAASPTAAAAMSSKGAANDEEDEAEEDKEGTTTVLAKTAPGSTAVTLHAPSPKSSTAGAPTHTPSPSSKPQKLTPLPWSPSSLASPSYHTLLAALDTLQRAKSDAPSRNTWQARQRGGQGEPFYRDPDGFEHGVWMWMDFGRKVFDEKWGRGPCDLRDAGLTAGDAWKVVPEWEKPEVRRKYAVEMAREEKENKRNQAKEAEARAKGEGGG